MKTCTVIKSFSMILILTLMMTIQSTYSYAEESTNSELTLPALTFTDLPDTHWAYSNVQYMVSNGIINGYPDNTFRPNDPFSRAAFAKLLVLSFDLEIYSGTDTLLADIPPTHWAYSYVMSGADFLTFYDYGNGDKYFYPDNPSEREDVAVAMVLAMGLNPDTADLTVLDAYMDATSISEGLVPYVALAVEYGVMQGSGGYFRPGDTLTRAEASTLFARFIQNIKDSYMPGKTVGIDATDNPAIMDDRAITAAPGTVPLKKGYWNLISITDNMPYGFYEYNIYGQDNYGYQTFENYINYDTGEWLTTSEYVTMRLRFEGYIEEYFDSNVRWSMPMTYYASNEVVTLALYANITRFERYETNFRWTTIFATLLPGDNWSDSLPPWDHATMIDPNGRKAASANVSEGVIDVKNDVVYVSNSFAQGVDGERMSLMVGYHAPAGQMSGSVTYLYEYIE